VETRSIVLWGPFILCCSISRSIPEGFAGRQAMEASYLIKARSRHVVRDANYRRFRVCRVNRNALCMFELFVNHVSCRGFPSRDDVPVPWSQWDTVGKRCLASSTYRGQWTMSAGLPLASFMAAHKVKALVQASAEPTPSDGLFKTLRTTALHRYRLGIKPCPLNKEIFYAKYTPLLKQYKCVCVSML